MVSEKRMAMLAVVIGATLFGFLGISPVSSTAIRV
jgi:hypothetical protein